MYIPQNICPNCPIVQLSATPCPRKTTSLQGLLYPRVTLHIPQSSSALAISNPYKGTKIIKIYLSQMSLGISETINPIPSSPTRTFTSYQSVIGLIHVTY